MEKNRKVTTVGIVENGQCKIVLTDGTEFLILSSKRDEALEYVFKNYHVSKEMEENLKK